MAQGSRSLTFLRRSIEQTRSRKPIIARCLPRTLPPRGDRGGEVRWSNRSDAANQIGGLPRPCHGPRRACHRRCGMRSPRFVAWHTTRVMSRRPAPRRSGTGCGRSMTIQRLNLGHSTVPKRRRGHSSTIMELREEPPSDHSAAAERFQRHALYEEPPPGRDRAGQQQPFDQPAAMDPSPVPTDRVAGRGSLDGDALREELRGDDGADAPLPFGCSRASWKVIVCDACGPVAAA